jgi:hypothetical protein
MNQSINQSINHFYHAQAKRSGIGGFMEDPDRSSRERIANRNSRATRESLEFSSTDVKSSITKNGKGGVGWEDKEQAPPPLPPPPPRVRQVELVEPQGDSDDLEAARGGNNNQTAASAESSESEDEQQPHRGRQQDKSLLFMPPHLRVVQVQETPMILGPDETIFDNLIFGVKQSPETDLDAVSSM